MSRLALLAVVIAGCGRLGFELGDPSVPIITCVVDSDCDTGHCVGDVCCDAAHPELSMQETRTAGIAADQLRKAGYEVTTGVGKTGVVGVRASRDQPH